MKKRWIAAVLLLLCASLCLPATAERTVLQNMQDRAIVPAQGALDSNPVLDGESPTTGLPADAGNRYQPMLVNVLPADGVETAGGKEISAQGLGNAAPWGMQYADIVYEGFYDPSRICFTLLFQDSFAGGQPTGVGPVRGISIDMLALHGEWQAGFVYLGAENNRKPILQLAGELGFQGTPADLDLAKNAEGYERISAKPPNNLSAELAVLRELIPSEYATARPFLFADETPYGDGYASASAIHLDWGEERTLSHFRYDAESGQYLRYAGDAPFHTFTDESREEKTQVAFSNIIIQRVTVEEYNGSRQIPAAQLVGRGNADLFIGGRYIPGYWVRESEASPTVYLDDAGNELLLSRGKSYIALFPSDGLLSFDDVTE